MVFDVFMGMKWVVFFVCLWAYGRGMLFDVFMGMKWFFFFLKCLWVWNGVCSMCLWAWNGV